VLLRAEQLSFGYGDQTRTRRASRSSRSQQPLTASASDGLAVRDVTIEVQPHAITGLLGPTGCGKTSLLKLLAGIVVPQRGRVTLDGQLLRNLARREVARHLAVVPQETHPAFDYTALEMVLMGRHPHLGAFQLEGPEDIALAHDALSATGTAALADRAYMTLSGGEKQRVVIASALAQQPQILLLDEPTASLDLGFQLEIQMLLQTLNRDRGVTMVLATHDLNLAASICHRLVLMRAGGVIDQGPTADVLTAANIRELYGVDAEVTAHKAAGHLTVVPVRRI
jgi:iron complex transport system ATP-binding protein